MNKETELRIEKEAREYALTKGYVNGVQIKWCELDYIAGATAQHTKAWNEAIDDCINYLFHHFPSDDATSSIIYGLNSLKLDPNQA